jgi:flagellar motor switch protein FliN
MLNEDYQNALRACNEADLQAWRNFFDLKVQVAVELGRTRLTASEVLALEENSIIKLSRSTGEGADVLAGGSRIARGEIIMIEDRTGVRINEIITKEL